MVEVNKRIQRIAEKHRKIIREELADPDAPADPDKRHASVRLMAQEDVLHTLRNKLQRMKL
jgi:hypothetical protein